MNLPKRIFERRLTCISFSPFKMEPLEGIFRYIFDLKLSIQVRFLNCQVARPSANDFSCSNQSETDEKGGEWSIFFYRKHSKCFEHSSGRVFCRFLTAFSRSPKRLSISLSSQFLMLFHMGQVRKKFKKRFQTFF